MTPEEINIAIAEACGWKDIKPGVFYTVEHYGIHPNPDIGRTQVPDFRNDLYAMRDAIHSLPLGRTILFIEHLRAIIRKQSGLKDAGCFYIGFLTPCNQYAEAFLKTIGKWKE